MVGECGYNRMSNVCVYLRRKWVGEASLGIFIFPANERFFPSRCNRAENMPLPLVYCLRRRANGPDVALLPTETRNAIRRDNPHSGDRGSARSRLRLSFRKRLTLSAGPGPSQAFGA